MTALFAIASTAIAQLRIDTPVLEMHSGESVHSMTLHNSGNVAIAVNVDLERVVSPETSGPHNELTAPAESDDITALPRIVRIPAMGSATTRIERELKKISTDEVYRLKLRPVRGPDSSQIALSYDLLLFVRPEQAFSKISLTRTSSGIALVNRGNSNALMSAMHLCDSSINVCKTLSTQRLYAKERWSIPVPDHFDIEHVVLHAEKIHKVHRESIQYDVTMLDTQ